MINTNSIREYLERTYFQEPKPVKSDWALFYHADTKKLVEITHPGVRFITTDLNKNRYRIALIYKNDNPYHTFMEFVLENDYNDIISLCKHSNEVIGVSLMLTYGMLNVNSMSNDIGRDIYNELNLYKKYKFWEQMDPEMVTSYNNSSRQMAIDAIVDSFEYDLGTLLNKDLNEAL